MNFPAHKLGKSKESWHTVWTNIMVSFFFVSNTMDSFFFSFCFLWGTNRNDTGQNLNGLCHQNHSPTYNTPSWQVESFGDDEHCGFTRISSTVPVRLSRKLVRKKIYSSPNGISDTGHSLEYSYSNYINSTYVSLKTQKASQLKDKHKGLSKKKM